MQTSITARSQGRILIVDDERDITSVLSDVLGDKGYETVAAHDGLDAIERYTADPFDLVITDLKMPRMGGLELLKALRVMNRDALVIMMTGYATVETAVDALKNGAYDYILKPFKVGALLKVVGRAFEKKRLEEENLQLREQITLLKLCEAVSSSLSLDEVLTMVVDAVRKEVDADGVELLFRPPRSRSYSRRLAVGKAAEFDAVFLDTEHFEHTFHTGLSLQNRGDELKNLLCPEAQGEIRSALSVPLMRNGEILGVLSAYSSSEKRAFLPREEKALVVLGDRAATSLENALLYADLEVSFRETIQGLALALEAKDAYTHGHSESVTRYCVGIAKQMGLSEAFQGLLEQAGLLHDIGKIGIASNILNKPEPLTAEEYELIKAHPATGKRILENISFLKDAIPIVYHHHERIDGKGYPEGLVGDEIPLGARVMQVADTYDAMTSSRAYRTRMGHEDSVAELRRFSGTQFDPECVDAFIRMCEDEGIQ
jgi:response regulator RpfG family c-di-GMP phosphodiesterase